MGWPAGCVAFGFLCKVPNTSGEAWKFRHTRRKTDRDDALRLAQLEANGQLPTVTLPAKPVCEKRALIAGRQQLVGRRVAVQNRLRSILAGHAARRPGLDRLARRGSNDGAPPVRDGR